MEGISNCYITVYAKLHPLPLHYTFEDIDEDEFNPKSEIRRLQIKFMQNNKNDIPLHTSGPPQSSGEPYIDVYKDVDDAYVDVF